MSHKVVYTAEGSDRPLHPLRKLSQRSVFQRLHDGWRTFFGRAPDTYSLRRKTAIALNASPAGHLWDWLQIFFTICGLVTYVKSTYDSATNDELDELLALLFSADLFLRWYVAPSRVTYLWDSAYPAIDIACVAPTYIQWGQGWPTAGGAEGTQLTFLRVIRCLRLLRILRTFRVLSYGTTPLQRQAMMLGLTT